MPDDAAARLPSGLSAAEIHSHTRASDGMVTARQLVSAAATAGLRVLCITDHDVLPDLREAEELGSAIGLEVVRGEEVTASFPPGIHVLGLFLERQVRMHMTVEDTVAAIHDQNGLAVLAHPFMPTWFASIGARRTLRLLDRHRVDGIELRHTAPVGPDTWRRLDAFYAANRDGLGAALGAGDSHFGAHDLGRVVTAFPGSSAADLRAAIEGCTTSPFVGWRSPTGPPLTMRLGQQYRSMVWLSLQRRTGGVGRGAGPLRAETPEQARVH